jgi:FKBP-type peptidyl-prolyl cis-trans isomerase SlpA
MKHQIGIASTVTLHLSLTLEDGTVAESTFGEAPLTFTMGDGALVQGLELALYGLRPGDTQRLELYPEQAFGLRDPAKIHRLPRAQFSPDMALEPGLIIGFTTAEGEEIPGAVLSVTDDEVEVDFNHPMAGHTMVFEVEILDVVPAETTAEE